VTFPPADYGANSPQISYGQAEGYAIAAGFADVTAVIIAAVGKAESGLRPARIQEGQKYGLTGWGWLQITPGDSVPSVGIDYALLIPLTCARAAKVKYDGQGLNAWTTFRDGSYVRYMQRNVSPIMPTEEDDEVTWPFKDATDAAAYMVRGWYETYLHREPESPTVQNYWMGVILGQGADNAFAAFLVAATVEIQSIKS